MAGAGRISGKKARELDRHSKENNITCTMCNRFLNPERFFWESKSIINSYNGRLHICTDCANKLFGSIYRDVRGLEDDFEVTGETIVFDQLTEVALKKMCRFIDFAFNYKAYESWKNQILNAREKGKRSVKKVFGVYKSKLTSAEKRGELSSILYDDSDKIKGVEDFKSEENEGESVVSEELKEKFGHGFSEEEYLNFERKYKKLNMGYSQKTSIHTEALISYIIPKVKEEMAMASGKLTEVDKWSKIAQKYAELGKISVKQLSKNDLTGGIDLVPQLVEAVEENMSLIPIMPKLKAQPYDDADLIIWAIIDKIREIEEKPRIEYKEIYDFYDGFIQEHYEQKGYTPEQVELEKQKRNNQFRDLGNTYVEPLYDNELVDDAEGDDV